MKFSFIRFLDTSFLKEYQVVGSGEIKANGECCRIHMLRGRRSKIVCWSSFVFENQQNNDGSAGEPQEFSSTKAIKKGDKSLHENNTAGDHDRLKEVSFRSGQEETNSLTN